MPQIRPVDPSDLTSLCRVWNSAFGPEWPLTERLLRQTFTDPFFEPEGLIGAYEGEELLGWVLCKSMESAGPEWGSLQNRGGIGAICVDPDYQRQGIATALLDHAEARLAAKGSPRSLLYVPHHLLPGIPAECLAAQRLFEKRGYNLTGREVFDLWRDLTDYEVPAKVATALARNPTVEIRPAREDEAAAVTAMVTREFPGGWTYTVNRHFGSGLPASEIIIAIEDEEVLGFCFTATSESKWLIPPVYWHPLLGDNYGGLGPIGLAESQRGRGLGLALCAIAVADLKRRGVQQMVIDWTTLTDFYGQMGFEIWKRYRTQSA